MTSASFHVPQTAQRGCIAIGNFDGVHKGHAVMLHHLQQMARANASPAVAVTFDPHPIAVLRPEFTPPILTTVRERIALLKQSGADEVVVLPVTPTLLEMSAEQFFEDVVLNQFHARGIVEGPNFHFGKDRRGNIDLLCRLSSLHQIHCQIVDSVTDSDRMISSSRIRELLCSRALSEAVDLLGHPYRLTGIVRQGAQRGRMIGFPTANLSDIATLLPAHGVYAGTATINGQTIPVAVNVGPNPTFGEHREKVECHIDGFEGDLYGHEFSVDLISEVRPLRAFGSVEELTRQIRSDVEFCREAARLQAAAGLPGV